jgi:opacity protein-like surface antigen
MVPLAIKRACISGRAARLGERSFRFHHSSIFFFAFVLASQVGFSQAVSAVRARPVESEVAVVGGRSVGNIHLFAYAEDRRINPIGLEYDRHSWGGLLTARVDYVAEILPALLLNEPARYGADGKALTTARQTQYGVGISPVGVRLLWRRNKSFKPYLVGKGGIAYFENRVLSTQGTHLNFSAQFGAGVEERLTRRLEMRLGYSDFHLSNGDTGARNPGIDFMYLNCGLAYRLGR